MEGINTTRRVIDLSINPEDLEESAAVGKRYDGSHARELLTGGRPPYVSTLSSREMDSLTAICDTLLPSLQPPHLDADDAMKVFYRTSASQTGLPDCLGGFMSGRLQHTALWMLRLALWFLSTWYGTFVMCGWLSISCHFPYFRKFSQVPPSKREEILLSFSLSSFFLYRMFFKGLKFLTTLLFFSQVDDKNQNISWTALGYPGPDPNFQTHSQKSPPEVSDEKEKQQEHHRIGPLCKSLVNLEKPKDVISQTLQSHGFPALTPLPNSGRKSSHRLSIRCDAVVVGSGSGGGVVAGVLAKAGYKVVVLEKGNYFARESLSLLEGPTMDQMYEGGGLLSTTDLGVVLLAGSTVGGGSAINWSASIRTPKHVVNEWCNTHGLELFGSEVYKHALDVVCERMGVQSEFEEESFNNAILRKGCLELGYPVKTIPRNSPSDHFCGWCCFGCRDGRKKGTPETWLVDLANSGNGVILPGCKAVKIIHEKKRGRGKNTARGVVFEYENRGGTKTRYEVHSKVTIVACGALGTPILLKKSGLKNPNIGKNLHLHPVVMAWGYFPEPRNEEKENINKSREENRDLPNSTNSPAHESKLKPGSKSYEGGIMTAMSTVVSNFGTSGYGAVIQTPALHPGMFSGLMPWVSGQDFKERMTRFSRTAHIFALARDQGSGEVSDLKSLKYQLHSSDEENLKKGLEKVLRIMAAAGAEEIGTHDCRGEKLNVKRVSGREFEKFVKRASSRRLGDLSTPICSAHQMGSCRMGVDGRRSVVKESGETWEVEGLFIADTSVFPTALGVNPMVTVQAIAYCTAQYVMEVLARKTMTRK